MKPGDRPLSLRSGTLCVSQQLGDHFARIRAATDRDPAKAICILTVKVDEEVRPDLLATWVLLYEALVQRFEHVIEVPGLRVF